MSRLRMVSYIALTCILTGIGAGACSLPVSSEGDEHPYELMKKYLEALRWKNYQAASMFWLSTRRDRWLEQREAEEDIVNYQGFGVKGFKTLENGSKVEARVRVEMYRNDTLVLEKKLMLLTWEKVDGQWFIVSEEWK